MSPLTRALHICRNHKHFQLSYLRNMFMHTFHTAETFHTRSHSLARSGIALHTLRFSNPTHRIMHTPRLSLDNRINSHFVNIYNSLRFIRCLSNFLSLALYIFHSTHLIHCQYLSLLQPPTSHGFAPHSLRSLRSTRSLVVFHVSNFK